MPTKYRPFPKCKKFIKKDYVRFNDPLIAALHHLAKTNIDEKYHGRLDASALVCTAIMTQCLLDTLLTQQSKTPQLAQSCTTRDCMSCQQEFSVTTRIVHGKPVPKLIRRYHRMFINPLNEHRYVLICYHCVQRLKKLRTYCTYCLHIPDRSLLRVAAKKKTNKENHATDLCDRCEFPYTQVENEDPVLRSAKPYQVQKTDVLDLKELGIR